ncbi:MAG TPA: radical SAM protein [Candidatus Krumholzibacteriaceae bacterium]|jgi:MoaA/NifB/PqqE/SkfB family radical SAM enzyme|nr:radical SAM protein [Candidatus Krumholzibacteriaceae bacterium]
MRLSSQKALRLMRRFLTPNSPLHAQWFLTNRCNYRCRSCGVWRDKNRKNEVSTEEVKAGLDALVKLGVAEIVLSGGNPLLRDDIDEIVRYASHRFITTIYDNGSMAPEKIDVLRNADFVAISLDTLDEEKNDYMRGVKGAYKKAIDAVEKLHAEGISVGVAPTISQLNLHEMEDFTRYFTGKGIPVWYAVYAHDDADRQLFGIGKKNDELEIVDKKAMVKLCSSLMKMKKEMNGIFITDKTLAALKHLFLTEERTWKCRALQNFLMVNPQGQVSGCHLYEPVATVTELPELWNSPKFNALRAKYNACEKCTYVCYLFYSIHSGMHGGIEILQDQLKNTRLLVSTAHKTKRVVA